MLMPDDGFVKIYRSIMNWDWYDDPNTFRLFVHCILKANYKEKEWHGITIPVGSFVTSYDKLAKELKLTADMLRTAIKKLKVTKNITVKSTSKYSIITVVSYQKNQINPKQNPEQIPSSYHTAPKQIPTTKERKNERKEEINYEKIFQNLRDGGGKCRGVNLNFPSPRGRDLRAEDESVSDIRLMRAGQDRVREGDLSLNV